MDVRTEDPGAALTAQNFTVNKRLSLDITGLGPHLFGFVGKPA